MTLLTYSASLPTRLFQGIPSVAISNGVLFAAWYAGPNAAEDVNNYVILSSSTDGGATWSSYWVINPDDANIRAHDVCLWTDTAGRLHVFWAQQTRMLYDGIGGVWEMSLDVSQRFNGAESWTTPQRLCDGVLMNKPLTENPALMPVSLWPMSMFSMKPNPNRKMLEAVNIMQWGLTGLPSRQGGFIPLNRSAADEPVLCRATSGTLICGVRTTAGIARHTSFDDGVTWAADPTIYQAGPETRFNFLRLVSGKLLMLYHNDPSARRYLTAYLSSDDGQTWPNSILLDARTGVSYPDMQQAADGYIYLVYDRNRTTSKEILMAKINEADIIAGSLVSSGYLARVVNAA